jgi:outer membrane protein assembly factor BamB
MHLNFLRFRHDAWWVGSLLILGSGMVAHGENWPQWRGPFWNGSTTETNLPAQLTIPANVAWTTPLPGRSGATPVLWGDAIYLPSPDADNNLWLFCLAKSNGAIRWRRQVATGDQTVAKNNMASCSAVADGTNVYSLFGTSDLAAFDPAGQQRWHRRLSEEFGAFANMFLYGASPLLFDGKLYVPILQRDQPVYRHAKDDQPERHSYLVCLDPATGKTLWRHQRQTEAQEEAQEAYTTPIPYTGPRGTELLIVGANCVTAHRPDTGAELWRFAGLNAKRISGGRIVPSPVTSPGYIYACGPKREVLLALRDGGSGEVTESQVAWRFTEFVPDVCTPLYYQNKLFVLDGDRQVMTCLHPQTGEKIWRGRLGMREIFSASPTGADGRIYCLSEEGTVVILAAGDKFEILATLALGEGPCRSSVVAADGLLLIRTAKNLYGWKK